MVTLLHHAHAMKGAEPHVIMVDMDCCDHQHNYMSLPLVSGCTTDHAGTNQHGGKRSRAADMLPK